MSKSKIKKYLVASLVLYSAGLILVILAGLIYFYENATLKRDLVKMIMLTNSSQMFQKPQAISMRSFYFYEVLNPNEIQSGEKPLLKERGPYVYDQKSEKRNVIFSSDGSNVTYTPVSTFYFRPDLSNGTELDSFMFINLPLAAIVDKFKSGQINLNPFIITILNSQLNQYGSIFKNLTVYDLINGYTDFLIELINQNQPASFKDGKFSLLNGRNGSEFQNYTVWTGKTDISKVGQIIEWKGLRQLPYWDTDLANTIKGSDGSMYGPFKTNHDSLYIFSPELCRSISLDFEKEGKLNDINTFDYHISKNIFANTTINSDNEGFLNEYYMGNGVFSLKKCSRLPMVISQPHFLNADSVFLKSLNGISSANPILHDSQFKIFPLLGIPVSASIRMQLNIKLEKSLQIDLYNNLTDVLLPFVWFQDSVTLNKDSFETLTKLTLLTRILIFLPVIQLLVGLLFIFIATYLTIKAIILLKQIKKIKLEAKKNLE